MRIAVAALAYFLIVFCAGFLFGTVRTLFLEPRFGPVIATAFEAPLLLITIVATARWVPRALSLGEGALPLALMGLGALALQQAADILVGTGLRDMSVEEQFAQFATAQGRIYAALVIAFALMPLLLNRWGKISTE